jgi:hypothetical protein
MPKGAKMTETTARRLRVLHVTVQAHLVYDDGSELAPGPVMEPVRIKLSELGGLADEISASVEAENAKAA